MKLKTLRLLTLLLILSLFVVGCGGASPEPAATEAPAEQEAPAEEEEAPAEEEASAENENEEAPAEEEASAEEEEVPAEEEAPAENENEEAPAEEEASAEEEEAPAEEEASAENENEEVPAEEAAEGTAYKIGFISAVTGPGSGLGVPERNTAELIATELAETGITGPDGVRHEVEIVTLDSESNPDTAASNASRLITEDEVDILVAGSLSGNAMAMLPIATESSTPMIAMASAGAIVKNPETGEVREWIFKVSHDNEQVAEALLIYLQAQGITSVCHLYENSGYGQDTLNQVTAVFEEAGIEIAYSDTFERTDTEFPQIVSLPGAGCEAVTVGAIPPGASMVHAAIVDAMPDMPVIQGSGVCNQQFIDLAPDAVEGSVIPCTPLVAGESLPDSVPQKELVLNYLSDYRDATGEETNQFGGIAYDALQWAIIGLSSLDDGLSLAERRAGIRDAIEGGVQDWAGTSGTFTITPDDHLGLDYTTAFEWVRIQDGAYVYTTPEQWK